MRTLYLAFSMVWLTVSCSGDENPAPEDEQVSSAEDTTMQDKSSLNLEMEESQEIDMNSNLNTSVANGDVEFFYPNKMLKAAGQMKNGKKNGLWKSYYDNGKQWSVNYYANGVLDGHSVTYYKNGQVRYVGDYSGGKRIGIWKFFQDDGKLIKEQDFSSSE